MNGEQCRPTLTPSLPCVSRSLSSSLPLLFLISLHSPSLSLSLSLSLTCPISFFLSPCFFATWHAESILAATALRDPAHTAAAEGAETYDASSRPQEELCPKQLVATERY